MPSVAVVASSPVRPPFAPAGPRPPTCPHSAPAPPRPPPPPPAPPPLRVARAQPQTVPDQPLPKLGLHPHRTPLRRNLPDPQQPRTQNRGGQQQAQRRPNAPTAGPPNHAPR